MEQNTLNLYSERGIMNALIFSIWEKKSEIDKFLSLSDLKQTLNFDSIESYDLYPEYSLSDFGEADLIIIVNYIDKNSKDVIFIEAKVKTYQLRRWKIETERQSFKNAINKCEGSSDIFYQFRLKNLLFNGKESINEKTGKGVKDPYYCNKRRKIEKDIRKIGKNEIVWKLFDKIKCCNNAYYLAIIPTKENIQINTYEKSKDVPKNIVFLSWKEIEESYNSEIIAATFTNNKTDENSQIY